MSSVPLLGPAELMSARADLMYASVLLTIRGGMSTDGGTPSVWIMPAVRPGTVCRLGAVITGVQTAIASSEVTPPPKGKGSDTTRRQGE